MPSNRKSSKDKWSRDLVVHRSPQFDFCYALADLAAPDCRLADHVFEVPGDEPWIEEARAIGWSLWLAVPHIFNDPIPAATVKQFLRSLSKAEPDAMAARIRRALTHSDATPTRRKADWLHFIGLDPAGLPDRSNPPSGPVELSRIVAILKRFAPYFERAWAERQPQLAAVGERAEDLVRGNATILEAIERFDLPIEFDAATHTLRALRGGHTLRLHDVGAVYLIPSVFNARRLWNTFDQALPATVFLPVGAVRPSDLRAEFRPPAEAVDPWLVCRAIGDPVRAAMLRMIAANSRTASELAAALNLSKANVSHHIFQLRESGLIAEQRNGRFIQLSARLETVDRISAALRRDLEAGKSRAISNVRRGG